MTYNNGIKQEIKPKFRESAYTKIKQEVGEESPEEMGNMEKAIETAAAQALKKRKKIIEHILNQKI